MKALLTSALILTALSGVALPAAAQGPSSTPRVIDVSQATYANVRCGETVVFRSGDQQFRWTSNQVSHAPFNLKDIAPAGFAASQVQVYVARNRLEMS